MRSKPEPINCSPALVAQWIEQEPSNLLVAGSIPAEGTKRLNATLRLNR